MDVFADRRVHAVATATDGARGDRDGGRAGTRRATSHLQRGARQKLLREIWRFKFNQLVTAPVVLAAIFCTACTLMAAPVFLQLAHTDLMLAMLLVPLLVLVFVII